MYCLSDVKVQLKRKKLFASLNYSSYVYIQSHYCNKIYQLKDLKMVLPGRPIPRDDKSSELLELTFVSTVHVDP